MFNRAGIPFLKEKPLSSLSGLAGGATAFQVKPAAGETGPPKALRFNDDDTTHLTRTPSGAGNRKTWTWSAWIKRSSLGLGGSNTEEVMWASNGTSDSTNAQIQFGEDDDLQLLMGYPSHDLKTTARYNDTGEWYHFVVAVDVTQGTNSNKVKMYVNGDQITDFATDQRSDYTNTDWAINSAQEHKIGNKGDNNRPFHGYMSYIHVIDGLQLTPTSFAEADGTTEQWIPKEYTGAYGTNGFFLEFANNSAATAATLGKDSSGNGHNWTPTNFSVTAGSGNDSLLDSPSPGDTADDTGAGGEITGNYCTLNPLDAESAVTLKQGNLQMDSGGDGSARGTIANVDQKWYFEATVNSGPGASQVGVHNANLGVEQFTSDHMDYRIDNGEIYGGSGSHPGTTFGTGDTIGVAVNKADATGTISFYKNGTLVQTRNLSDATNDNPVVPNTRTPSSGVLDFNFGQREFRDAAPTNYKCWASPNLAAPAIAKPNLHFDSVTYTGTGASRSITSLDFGPDFVWMKKRNSSEHHICFDQVRGTEASLFPSGDYVEGSWSGEGISAWLSNGWTIGDSNNANENTDTYVAWNWEAGSSVASTSNSGSATNYTRWTNSTAGFSIIKATISTGSGYHQKTIDHGLGVAPGFIMGKGIDAAEDWRVYHSSLGFGGSIYLNESDAFNGSDSWKISATSSSQFTFDSYGAAQNMVFYVWAPVNQYSAVGSYTGLSGEPFVSTGFRPAYVLLKRSDNSGSWYVFDNARSPYNEASVALRPNSNVADQSYNISMLSNGFLVESSSDGDINGSGANYIWFAIAESPRKYSRAR